MKKRISYILLFSFVFNSVLYFFLFPFLVHSFKERFEDEKEELLKCVNKVIDIHRTELHKINYVDRKEIIYEGDLYDIIQKKEEGDRIVFYCYHDKEEENAIEGDRDFTEKEKNKSIDNIFIPDYIGVLCFTCFKDPVTGKTDFINKPSQFYNPVILEIPNPPPNS